jgi:hypothetical protein
MANKRKLTYYEVLGVPRDARNTDIGRAYKRLKAEITRDTAVPEPEREALVEEAYATLFDLDRRAAYDESLVVPDRQRRMSGGIYAVGAIVALGAIGYGIYLYTLPKKVPPPMGRNPQDILYTASLAVGRVESIDMGGQATPIGLAFAVDEDIMLTACKGIQPGAVLRVNLPPRTVPAQVMTADEERGLCKLSAKGVGSKPLPLITGAPRVGEKVYATRVNSIGQVALTEGKVKQVYPEATGRQIEASIEVPAGGGGGPLLDSEGRVIGVTMVAPGDGLVRHVEIPAAWIAALPLYRPPEIPAAAPRAPPPEPASPLDPEHKRIPKSLENVPPERIEKLEKAFRPPPTVPDDLGK